MNKKMITIFLLLAVFSFAAAFENSVIRLPQFQDKTEEPLSAYALTGNPAAALCPENLQILRIGTAFSALGYRRAYDPAATRLYRADFTTLRRIDDRSFFSTNISYDEYRQRDIFASMEKDFYDDYFSMIDSTLGNTAYYGPRLQILYNIRLTNRLFFGVEADYGVERSLKDTFPQTITIMRNSHYRAGFEYRGQRSALGIFGRYYDDQTHYEAVKQYSEVETKTYYGYNVYYNELATSTAKKRRTRNGLEYGAHAGFGTGTPLSLDLSVSGLHRISRADLLRGSYTRERGLWQRQGVHLTGNLNWYPEEGPAAVRVYADYLAFEDWGKSLISNALVIENEEVRSRFGAMLVYRPSLAQQAYAGAEGGTVSYDYREYVFPFADVRGGFEWKFYAGAGIYLGAKTRTTFSLGYEKEIPRFYWNTTDFENIEVIINLEQLFSFGYINLSFEYISKKPANDLRTVESVAFGLSIRRK